MSTIFILSQVCVFTGTAIDFIARIMKTKKWILIFMIIASFFYVSSYIFLNSPLAAIINAINLVRSLVYLFIDEKNKPFKSYIAPMIITIVATCISVAVFWNNAIDLFMIASLTMLSIVFAFKNLLAIRIVTIANAGIWVAYNILLNSFMGALCSGINILVALIAIILYDIIEPRKKKHLAEKQEQPLQNEEK